MPRMPGDSLQETEVRGKVILGSSIIFWSHQELHWGSWEQRGGGTIGPKYDSSLAISKQLLGSDACSCSTAATHCGTVLAGKNVLNCTLGGKTTGGRNMQYKKDNELLSLYGQLGQKSGPIRTSQGIINTKHQQIKSPAAGSTDTVVPEEV